MDDYGPEWFGPPSYDTSPSQDPAAEGAPLDERALEGIVARAKARAPARAEVCGALRYWPVLPPGRAPVLLSKPEQRAPLNLALPPWYTTLAGLYERFVGATVRRVVEGLERKGVLRSVGPGSAAELRREEGVEVVPEGAAPPADSVLRDALTGSAIECAVAPHLVEPAARAEDIRAIVEVPGADQGSIQFALCAV
ncbi:MAG TPA: hypothetical protein VLH79_10270, partial [Chthonomonadales bacterium]|nr:hypothetical protein [Chthonomonadales bacterium]